jgi:hypothetical protein
MHAETGRIRDVVYAGMVTRFVVELDGGGELRSSSRTSRPRRPRHSSERRRAVLLEWRPEHQLEIDNAGRRKERA